MYNIIDDFSLRGHNTFGLECVAAKFAEYTDEKDLPSLWSEIEDLRLPAFHIGEGSNILFTGRYEGVVVSSNILDMEMIPTGGGEVSITAGAGIKLDNLIERCCDAGLWGLENLSLIPGTVGASVVQNVGAYGRDASDSVLKVRVFDTQSKRF
ncbi:MAG: FAD-binding protein, partial [Paramuribaculum sp.]|nr:FAD-binding protein [Paramuribaculum sp.]